MCLRNDELSSCMDDRHGFPVWLNPLLYWCSLPFITTTLQKPRKDLFFPPHNWGESEALLVFSRFTHSWTTEKYLLGHYASFLLQTSCSFKDWSLYHGGVRGFTRTDDSSCSSNNSYLNSYFLFQSKIQNGQSKHKKIQYFLYLHQQKVQLKQPRSDFISSSAVQPDVQHSC